MATHTAKYSSRTTKYSPKYIGAGAIFGISKFGIGRFGGTERTKTAYSAKYSDKSTSYTNKYL